MYLGCDRVANGLWDARLTVDVESLWDRVDEGGARRGDFLVTDGDRLGFLLGDSVPFDDDGGAAEASSFDTFSDDLRLPQANLIAHGRFGATAVGAVVAAACVTTGGSWTAGLFLPQANVIQRFLGATSTGSWDLGEMLTASGACEMDSLLLAAVAETGTG